MENKSTIPNTNADNQPFFSLQEFATVFDDPNTPMSIFPMMEDAGFKKYSFCKFHYWNIDQSKCLRCGMEDLLSDPAHVAFLGHELNHK